jgi:hypothetical protein
VQGGLEKPATCGRIRQSRAAGSTRSERVQTLANWFPARMRPRHQRHARAPMLGRGGSQAREWGVHGCNGETSAPRNDPGSDDAGQRQVSGFWTRERTQSWPDVMTGPMGISSAPPDPHISLLMPFLSTNASALGAPPFLSQGGFGGADGAHIFPCPARFRTARIPFDGAGVPGHGTAGSPLHPARAARRVV